MFKIGDKVRLKSGGLEMEVIGVGPPDCVVWCRGPAVNVYGGPLPTGKLGRISYFDSGSLEAVSRSMSERDKIST
jgi:hypothetical protein